jgi:nucleoid-associated protein YgaU
MAVSRYKNENILQPEETRSRNNNVTGPNKRIKFYESPVLHHPTKNQRAVIRKVAHIWKETDSYWKLSSKFYKDAQYWWIIAWYNQAPTESHLHPGERIFIPTNLTDALQILGV